MISVRVRENYSPYKVLWPCHGVRACVCVRARTCECVCVYIWCAAEQKEELKVKKKEEKKKFLGSLPSGIKIEPAIGSG